MEHLILTSILVITIVAPVLAARGTNAVRAAKRLLAFMLAFEVVYAVVLTRVFVRLFVPEWFR